MPVEEEEADEEAEEGEEGGGGGLEGNLRRDQISDKERISIFLARFFFHCFFKVLKGTNMVEPKDMIQCCLSRHKKDLNL